MEQKYGSKNDDKNILKYGNGAYTEIEFMHKACTSMIIAVVINSRVGTFIHYLETT